MIKWTVPARYRHDIVRELEQFDINARRLFPELDGLCRSLWQTEALKEQRGQYAKLSPQTDA